MENFKNLKGSFLKLALCLMAIASRYMIKKFCACNFINIGGIIPTRKAARSKQNPGWYTTALLVVAGEQIEM